MDVKQIYSMINEWQKEVVGASQYDPTQPWIIREDLSNLTQVGDKLLDPTSITAAGERWRDNYVRSMIDRIGRMVFVERGYRSTFPDLRRDEWTYGSIMTKSRCKRFEAVANPSWSLQPGQVVEQFAFTPPEVMTLFYNNKSAWQVDCSFAEIQLRESFTSPREMDRFMSMIRSAIERAMDRQMDLINSRTLNGLVAEKLYRGHGVVDLLAAYNATVPAAQQLTASQAITSVEWQRFAAYQILLYKQRMAVASSWFMEADEDGFDTQTPADRLRVAIHSDIAEALDVYLQSETYHNQLTDIGSYDSVPMWQTSGSDRGFDFGATSRISVTLPSDSTVTVDRTHIIAVMWDWDAAMVCNTNRRVTSSYNANGEFFNEFFKVDTMSAIDLMENCIVFVLGDGTVPTISISGTATAAVGATSTLTATTTGAGDAPTIQWYTLDSEVATVVGGVVTGVAAGETTIGATIRVDGTIYRDTVKFTVTAAE